jgi:hypothetical protein
MTSSERTAPHPGDTIEIRGRPGAPSRIGVVLEVLGDGPHRHYRVRWDERHESLFFPAGGEGVHVHRARRPHPRASAR